MPKVKVKCWQPALYLSLSLALPLALGFLLGQGGFFSFEHLSGAKSFD